MMKNPEKRASSLRNARSSDWTREGSTFDWLEADDRAISKANRVTVLLPDTGVSGATGVLHQAR